VLDVLDRRSGGCVAGALMVPSVPKPADEPVPSPTAGQTRAFFPV
jgi:hypothetical protein